MESPTDTYESEKHLSRPSTNVTSLYRKEFFSKKKVSDYLSDVLLIEGYEIFITSKSSGLNEII